MLHLFIYCLPALGWGLMPIISKKVGGNPTEQLVGTTLAALGMGLSINFMSHVEYTMIGIIVSFISGIFWSLGQFFQFIALKKGEVTKIMPISNGTQLLFTAVSSGIILKEWDSAIEIWVTLFVIVILIFAMILFSKSDKVTDSNKQLSILVTMLLISSSFFLMIYVTITNVFNITGMSIFLPQAFGMFVSATLISLGNKERNKKKIIIKNSSIGISWSVANISLFYSAARLGLGLSYTISQLCIVVSILGGIFILGEQKSKQELIRLILGITLFLVSIFILSQFK